MKAFSFSPLIEEQPGTMRKQLKKFVILPALLLLLSGVGWTGGQALQSAAATAYACENNICETDTQNCIYSDLNYDCAIEEDGNCEDTCCNWWYECEDKES